VPKPTPGKQYKTIIRGGALEFENVGRLKDQTVEQLTHLFDRFLESRQDVIDTNDYVIAGKVINHIPDVMSRELYFDDLEFRHHPSETQASFILDSKTCIDFKYVNRHKKCSFQIEPSLRFVYIDNIKGIFNQTAKGGILVSCEIPIYGVISKKEACKEEQGNQAIKLLKDRNGVDEEALNLPNTSFLVKNLMQNKKNNESVKFLTLDSILIDWYRLQRVIMCDNATQARNAEFQKDTYESVAFLRYGFDFKNPSELYLCKRDPNSRRCVINKLKNGEDLTN